MTPDELRANCLAAQHLQGQKQATIYLSLPIPKNVGGTIRLFGRHGGPRGYIVTGRNGYLTALFRADRILAYLDKHL